MLCSGDRIPVALLPWQNLLVRTVGFSFFLVEPQVPPELLVAASTSDLVSVFLVQLQGLVVWVPFFSGV